MTDIDIWATFVEFYSSPIRSLITTLAHTQPNVAGMYDMVPTLDFLLVSSAIIIAPSRTGSGENTA